MNTQRQAETVKACVESIKRQFDTIETKVLNSRTYWEGSASNLHLNKFNKIKSSCNSITRRLSEHPDDLTKMAGIYRTTEAESTQSANSLSSNIIS